MPDIDNRRKQALRLVRVAAERIEKATRDRDNAMRMASDSGCSLRDIADTAGVSHTTVKNVLDRTS